MRYPERIAIVALALGLGCGARPPAPEQDLGTRIARARYAVAADPTDARAHLQLARLEHEAGRPGGAIAQYELARRGTELSRSDRQRLAGLYAERAAQRLALADGAAWQDLDRARDLDPALAISPELEAAALFEGALAALRQADMRLRRGATELIERAGRVAPADPRLAVLDPGQATVDELGRAAVWVWDGGARRAGLELLDRYHQRGGADPEVTRRFLAARWWWGGAAALPGPLELERLWATGVEPCRFAVADDDHGCDRTLASVAADPDLSRQVWRRAARYRWRTDRSEQAGPWLAIALRAWLDGEVASFDRAVADRLDLAALADAPERLPPYATPTVLRLAGRERDAAAARAEAIRSAAAAPAWARSLLVLEAALADAAEATIDRILAAGSADSLALTVAALDARARGALAREARLLAASPDEWALAYLERDRALGPVAARTGSAVDAHRLARWRRALAGDRLAAGRDRVARRWQELGTAPEAPSTDAVVALGLPDPLDLAVATDRVEVADAPALADIVRAFAREPAVADRLARDYATAEVAVGARAPILAALFDRLGDPVRALRWAEAALAESPDHPAYQLAVADYAAATGDLDRANLHVITAAAASGDPGPVFLVAARRFLALGRPLEAVQLGRRALDHAAPGDDVPALELLLEATRALGRERDAAAVAERLAARRGSAHPVEELPVGPSDPIGVVAHAATESEGTTALLQRTAAWNPGDVAVRAALLARLEPSDPAAAGVVAELMAIAIAGDHDAYAALVEPLRRLDAADVAAAVQAELEQPAALSARP